jgi:signal transduction histidine kinase
MLKILRSAFYIICPQLGLSWQENNDYSRSAAKLPNAHLFIQYLLNEINALRQRELAQSEFLSHMSHELRAPLNSIINFNKFVIRHDLGHINPSQEQALRHSVESAEHLLALVNNLLDVSKIEAGMMQLFIEDNINIQKQLDDIASYAKLAIEDKPIELQIKVSSDIPDIVGDRRRIKQMLLNLISNACKFTQEGTINISGTLQDATLIILITDSGSGISEQDLQRIFEPFEQTQLGLATASSTGLGLAITKNLIEAHGGKMIVRSTKGVGSAFGFSIPTRSKILLNQMQDDMRQAAG